jgi:hypothetical protein
MLQRKIIAIAASLALASLASASVTFTVTGTVSSADPAFTTYTVGLPGSFTFVLNDFSPASPEGIYNSGTSYTWHDEDITLHPELWDDVSGGGLTGSWTRPQTANGAPYSFLQVTSSGLALVAATETTPTTDTGLSLDGFPLSMISFNLTLSGITFDVVSALSLPDPDVYFADYVGTYAVGSPSSGILLSDTFGKTANFDVTSVTISAIPEPASWGVGAGMLALGLATLGRRRARR